MQWRYHTYLHYCEVRSNVADETPAPEPKVKWVLTEADKILLRRLKIGAD